MQRRGHEDPALSRFRRYEIARVPGVLLGGLGTAIDNEVPGIDGGAGFGDFSSARTAEDELCLWISLHQIDRRIGSADVSAENNEAGNRGIMGKFGARNEHFERATDALNDRRFDRSGEGQKECKQEQGSKTRLQWPAGL